MNFNLSKYASTCFLQFEIIWKVGSKPLGLLCSSKCWLCWDCLEQFEQQAKEKVLAITWVKEVNVQMTAQPAKPIIPDDVPLGLKKVSNIIAVSSCKVGG